MTEPTRRTFLRTTAVAGSITIAGCSAGQSTEPSGGSDGGTGDGSGWTRTDTVDMTDGLAYEPKKIEVSAGTTVTWKNPGSIGHTVTAYEDEIPDGAAYFASGEFDSEQAATDGYSSGQEGNIPAGESYEHTFETKGEYEYYCIPHEMNGMVGYVKVV